jgi:hypothetical protein
MTSTLKRQRTTEGDVPQTCAIVVPVGEGLTGFLHESFLANKRLVSLSLFLQGSTSSTNAKLTNQRFAPEGGATVGACLIVRGFKPFENV